MPEISAIGLFCEDIREEKSGAETLVGIFSDNLLVPKIPFAFAKLNIYVRIHFSVDFTIRQAIIVNVISSDGKQLTESRFETKYLAEARKNAKAKGAPIVGLISRATAAPAPIQKAGRMIVKVRCGRQEIVAGALNIVQEERPSAPSTAQMPPS